MSSNLFMTLKVFCIIPILLWGSTKLREWVACSQIPQVLEARVGSWIWVVKFQVKASLSPVFPKPHVPVELGVRTQYLKSKAFIYGYIITTDSAICLYSSESTVTNKQNLNFTGLWKRRIYWLKWWKSPGAGTGGPRDHPVQWLHSSWSGISP